MPPLDQGPLLQVRVRNLRHRVTVPFDERSRGFVWFFSFLAYFSKLEAEATQPLILLLDEPTSSMDYTSEQQLKQRLSAVAAHKTMVIVTHRNSLLELANRVIVLDDGKVVADGPRDQVIQALQGGRVGRGS